ncbi:MAG: HDOD domain-containing protein [Oscillospiraceae bacterium]|jgi:EAL and modified HD-GYP domain-containing signal transduction protein|nr:HDOD domain-containing protein [Oscillospiraceae bacterium]
MRFFICALPVFDADMAVHAYRMMTRDGDKLLGSAEDFRMLGGELLAPALEYVKDIGVEPFAGRNDFFVGITKYQLLMGMPLNMKIPPDNFVCVIDREALSDNASYSKIGILKRNKYRLAVEGLTDIINMETTVKVFDFILLSYEADSFISDLKKLQPYLSQIRVIVTDIPDMKTFEMFSGASGVLLSGDFYNQPITEGLSEISPLKINALHLIKQINDDSFDLIDAAKTIERDPSMSISLLRFINTMNPNRSKKIESIRGAVAILGQKEVKKWATVAISISLAEDRPSEITRLSLIRAKFAENLAPAFSLAIKSGSLFIAGLFSMLDIILQMPMHKAILEVAVDDEINAALVEKKGRMSEVLSLIYAYERADWHNASIKMVRNGIDIAVLSQAFLDALFWYRQLLDTINDAEPEQKSEGEAGDE